jgi:hypothetical protein
MTPPLVISVLILAPLMVLAAPLIWWDGYAREKGWIKPDPEELWLLEKNRYRGGK